MGKSRGSAANNIYTVLSFIAVLALGFAVAYVFYRSGELFPA